MAVPNPAPAATDSRVSSALIVALVGLTIPTGLVVFLELRGHTVNDIAATVGLFTGLVGTLVGAFLGVQVGSAGKEKAEAGKEKAEAGKEKAEGIAQRALAALPPEQAQSVLGQQ